MITDKEYDINNLRRIRKSLGYLGLTLPISLIIFSLIFKKTLNIQPSISHYYHTALRDIFLFVIFTVGFFFIKYKGFPNKNLLKNDTFLTNLAGVACIGLAFMPTDFVTGINLDSAAKSIFGIQVGLHYFFAVSLFLILALISIIIFPLTYGNKASNAIECYIYRFSGYGILICLLLAFYFEKSAQWQYSTLFFESLMLVLFSISWLVKGRALGKMGEKLYIA